MVTVTKVMVSTLHVQHPTQVKEIMVVLVLVMAVVEAVVPVLVDIHGIMVTMVVKVFKFPKSLELYLLNHC